MLRASTDANYIELGWYGMVSWMHNRTMPINRKSEATQP